MDARSDLLRAVGPHVCHVTAWSNLGGIAAHGLRPAAMLAAHSGHAPEDIALRPDRNVLTLPDGATARYGRRSSRGTDLNRHAFDCAAQTMLPPAGVTPC